jgi:hypothetical protein
MKCFQCKKEIKNELDSIHIGDGDFVCNKICEQNFINKRNSFFNNIGNDKWYEDNYFPLS